MLSKDVDYTNFEPGDSPGMKQMIVAALLKMHGNRGEIK